MPTIMTGQPVVVGRVGSLYEGVTAAVGVTVRVIVGGGETETVTVDGEMEALDGPRKWSSGGQLSWVAAPNKEQPGHNEQCDKQGQTQNGCG